MLIGELARRAGVSRDTVRFYERAGLISSGEKEAGSRLYKTFDEEALERLIFIRNGQAGGSTLRQIKEILDQWGPHIDAVPRDELIAAVEVRIAEMDAKLRRMHEVRDYLAKKLELAKAGLPLKDLAPPGS